MKLYAHDNQIINNISRLSDGHFGAVRSDARNLME